MPTNSFKTLDDIAAIVSDDTPEGVTLEYKSSDILVSRDVGPLCKTVTALANSAGGQFVIGIESNAGKPVRLDGGVPGNSRLDWIHKVINGNTYPPVESVEVLELREATGSYYVVDVPPSINAPHQSNDKRYYKRRGTHSEPMEHYEIEDVRNRPKQSLAPLRISLFTQDQLAFLHMRNDHASDSIKNIKCRLDTNFEFERDGITSLDDRGIREFRAQAERYFILDTVPMMIQKNPEPEMHVHVTYEFHDAAMSDSVAFYLADLINSAIIRSPTVNAIQTLTEKVDKLAGHLQNIRRNTEELTKIVDGTGLRLSQRTLQAFKNADHLFDPHEFDWDGYRILLDISSDDAMHLYQVFGVLDSNAGKAKRYAKLPQELRDRFEKRFKVPVD